MALALKVIAVLIFAGAFFAGIAMAGSEKIVTGRSYYPHVEKTFEIGTALIWWASGLVSGTLLLGFAQIVEHTERQIALLERIAAKR